MSLAKPKSMMASLAAAIDSISQQFCCNPYNLIHEYYDFDEEDSRSSDTHCVVDGGRHNLHSPVSNPPNEILIPTHASLYHTAPAYRQVARISHDAIIEPPPITRFPHLIAQVAPAFEKVASAYTIERDQECILLVL